MRRRNQITGPLRSRESQTRLSLLHLVHIHCFVKVPVTKLLVIRHPVLSVHYYLLSKILAFTGYSEIRVLNKVHVCM